MSEQWECKDCNCNWSESNAIKCFNCLSDNIYLYWKPGMAVKPKRIKLAKPKRIRLKTKE